MDTPGRTNGLIYDCSGLSVANTKLSLRYEVVAAFPTGKYHDEPTYIYT